MKSGSTYVSEATAEGAGTHLIDKFGIGFYSAPLVASRAAVKFKCNIDPVQHIWEHSAEASLLVGPDPLGNALGRGSRVAAHLGEGRSRCPKHHVHHR